MGPRGRSGEDRRWARTNAKRVSTPFGWPMACPTTFCDATGAISGGHGLHPGDTNTFTT